MSKNGRHSPMGGGGTPHSPRGSPWAGRLPSLSAVLGAALFLLFMSQLFTTSPFDSLHRGRAATGEQASAASYAADSWRGSGSHRYAPPDSHAYLRAAFRDFPGGSEAFVANISRWYDPRSAEERMKVGACRG